MKVSQSPVVRALFSPMPERWRPFTAFFGGLIVLAALVVFGRHGGEAWRFFASFTLFAAVFGLVWSLYRARTRRSPAA